jgi:hypothetical protein
MARSKIGITTNLLFVTVMLLLTNTSCSYDKEDLLYNDAICNTPPSSASYTTDVLPILRQNCYRCHADANPPGGIQMGTYTDEKSIALSGKMYGAISHKPGFLPMPFGESKLPACTIAIIKKWIDDGAPNN